MRGRTYAEPHKCLYLAESYDSSTGEYKLARLLSTSPSIVWWHRLHIHDQAFIYYTPRDKYYPDFVTLDSDGVHWIIEGKDERGRLNDTVQAKRKAAEALVRKLVAHPDYVGKT